MFEKLFNFFTDPKLKTLFTRIGIASAITLSGSLSYYYFNPLAFSTTFQGFLLGFVPTLLVGGGVTVAFFYDDLKKSFLDRWNKTVDKAVDLDVEEEPKPEQEQEEKLEAEPEIVPEVSLSENLENSEELEPFKETESISDSEPEEVNPPLEPEVHDEVLKTETDIQDTKVPEIKIVDTDLPSEEPKPLEKTIIENETQQLEFMKVRENLRKVESTHLFKSPEKPELKSILKSTEDIDSSSSESNTKKVQFANPIANETNIQAHPEKEQPVAVEFAAVTHQEDKKDEQEEVVPVKVKLEPAEEQPVVFLPQHEAQRAKTRERRAQLNIQRNHDQANVLPEGTTRTRNKVDRFSNSKYH